MRKAGYSCDPLHVLCTYDTRSIMLLNFFTLTKPHCPTLKKCLLQQWKYGRMARNAYQLVSCEKVIKTVQCAKHACGVLCLI